MSEKLKPYEVIGGLLGVCMERKAGTISLPDRTKLYQCVRDLCLEKRDIIFPFEFRRRSGKWTSPDVDLGIRNLEDSKRLECLNPSLVDFRWTSLGVEEYENELKPKLAGLDLLNAFEKHADQLLLTA